jgi:hypothetical protein
VATKDGSASQEISATSTSRYVAVALIAASSKSNRTYGTVLRKLNDSFTITESAYAPERQSCPKLGVGNAQGVASLLIL